MNGTAHRPAAGERRIRTAAFAVACGWVGLFMVLFRPAPPRAAASVPALPKLHYVCADGRDSLSSDPVGLWSPRLFSLPSAAGFSGLQPGPETGLRPKLELPVPQSAFLDYVQPAAAAPSGLDALSLEVRSFFDAQLSRRTVSTTVSPSPFDVEVLEGFSSGDLIEAHIPDDPALAKDSWQALLEVEFQPGGDAAHVFVLNENRLGQNREKLLRSVRRWRLKPALSVRRGLLLVQAAGRGGEETP